MVNAMDKTLHDVIPYLDTMSGSVGKCIAVILVIAIGLLLLSVISFIAKSFIHKTSLDPLIQGFRLRSIKVVGIIILILIVILDINKNVSTALVTVLGVSGAAIALALKDSLSNIAGGIVVLATKPFNHGDFIEISGIMGSVERIGFLLTTLKTADNKVVTIPNGLISTGILINASREEKRRVDCVFRVSFNENLNKVKETMMAVINENKLVLSNPAPIVGVAGEKEGYIAIDLKAWCKTENYLDAKYLLEEDIRKAFNREGFDIPIQKVDIHIDK